MDKEFDCIVIGAGLSGLTAAYKLTKANKKVLVVEKESILGGRTSSWVDNGMYIESGFHRHIGYYKNFPKLLKEMGLNLSDIISWETEAEIIVPKEENIVLGIAPFSAPITFINDLFKNVDCFTIKDKLSLLKLFTRGMFDYTIDAKTLDHYSVLDYANRLKLTENIKNYVVPSLSTGIFFLPKEKYSAKKFFGLFYPALYRFPLMRIGAYKIGMKEAFIDPISKKIETNGGIIKVNIPVKKLLQKGGKVIGIKTAKDKLYAKNIILAADIGNAKKLTKPLSGKEINKLAKMPTISAITVQLELKERVLPKDRTTFAPTTLIASFTEESATTFKASAGRLSLILVSKKYLETLSDKKILKLVIGELSKIGIEVKSKLITYRVVRHINKFYDFSKGNDNLRPMTKNSSKGLILAGDYTYQKWYSTMEGAVYSGIKAAEVVIENLIN